MPEIETVKDDEAVAAEGSAATKSKGSKFYAWSTFKGLPIKLGDEVTAKKLDCTEEQLQQHIKSGAIREEKYPISKEEISKMGANIISVRDYHLKKLKELNPDD